MASASSVGQNSASSSSYVYQSNQFQPQESDLDLGDISSATAPLSGFFHSQAVPSNFKVDAPFIKGAYGGLGMRLGTIPFATTGQLPALSTGAALAGGGFLGLSQSNSPLTAGLSLGAIGAGSSMVVGQAVAMVYGAQTPYDKAKAGNLLTGAALDSAEGFTSAAQQFHAAGMELKRGVLDPSNGVINFEDGTGDIIDGFAEDFNSLAGTESAGSQLFQMANLRSNPLTAVTSEAVGSLAVAKSSEENLNGKKIEVKAEVNATEELESDSVQTATARIRSGAVPQKASIIQISDNQGGGVNGANQLLSKDATGQIGVGIDAGQEGISVVPEQGVAPTQEFAVPAEVSAEAAAEGGSALGAFFGGAARVANRLNAFGGPVVSGVSGGFQINDGIKNLKNKPITGGIQIAGGVGQVSGVAAGGVGTALVKSGQFLGGASGGTAEAVVEGAEVAAASAEATGATALAEGLVAGGETLLAAAPVLGVGGAVAGVVIGGMIAVQHDVEYESINSPSFDYASTWMPFKK
jgi:hypothetical protein